jgi:hypothetical protein
MEIPDPLGDTARQFITRVICHSTSGDVRLLDPAACFREDQAMTTDDPMVEAKLLWGRFASRLDGRWLHTLFLASCLLITASEAVLFLRRILKRLNG